MRLHALVDHLMAPLGPNLAVQWRREGRLVEARLLIHGTFVTGISLPLSWRRAELAIQIVGAFQDTVIEEAGGAALPPCAVPGHPHPAVLRRANGSVGWRCPRDDRPVAH